VRFCVLGPVTLDVDGRTIPLPGTRERCLLGVLLLARRQPVPVERLIELLWADKPPADARAAVHTYMSRLRRALASAQSNGRPMLLTRRGSGYRLDVEPVTVDLHRFEQLVDDALRCTDLAERARLLREALTMWRGAAMADIGPPALRDRVAGHLDELRLSALRRRIDTDMALGRHHELLGELASLVAERPFDEELIAQFMLAMYRSGRRFEALDTYRRIRRRIVDDHGLEPGEHLQRIETAILRADPELDLAEAGRQPPVVVPAQLPAPVTGFTGRDKCLDALDALVPDPDETPPRTVVISAIAGTAGVGKTALAVHWGQRAADRFPDGQLFLDLRGYAADPPLRPIDGLAWLLRSLGVPAERVPVDVAEASALYRSMVAGRRLLIVLDNARDAEQARPLLPATPGCMVVLTSRDQLAGLAVTHGAHGIVLDVLSPVEALTLLERVLGVDRTRAEPVASESLARLCGFLPLGLRIAAAHLLAQPRMAIARYVTKLNDGDRLGTLSIPGDPKTAVAAAFDLSYHRLPTQVQLLFRLLGLHPGIDFSAASASALCGIAVADAAHGLDQLVVASLITTDGIGRYRLHDLLRLYARHQSGLDDTAADREAARHRLLYWYLRCADAAADLINPTMTRLGLPDTAGAPDSVPFVATTAALRWLDAERANLVAAVQDAAEQGPRAIAWHLTDRLRWYLWSHRYTIEWVTCAEVGLSVAEADGDLAGQAAMQLSLGNLQFSQDNHDAAGDRATRALEAARKAGWTAGQSAALSALGVTCREQGRLADSAQYFHQALELEHDAGNHTRAATILTGLGTMYRALGQLADSARHLDEAVTLFRRHGSPPGLANAHESLGATLHLLGRFDRAAENLTTALTMFRAAADPGGEAAARCSLAQLHRDECRYRAALDQAEAALSLVRANHYTRMAAYVEHCLGAIHAQLGERDRAAAHYRAALDTARAACDQYVEAMALLAVAQVLRGTDQSEQVVGHAEQALTLARQMGYTVVEGHAHCGLAEIHLTGDRTAKAIHHARLALRRQRRTGHLLGEAHASRLIGLALQRSSGPDAAIPVWRNGLERLTDAGLDHTSEAADLRALLA
jgi:DNA-binding SARP family transcriptional activator/tetratricopeptide (TPR) repeat protein